jgi:hypothetical protein
MHANDLINDDVKIMPTVENAINLLQEHILCDTNTRTPNMNTIILLNPLNENSEAPWRTIIELPFNQTGAHGNQMI